MIIARITALHTVVAAVRAHRRRVRLIVEQFGPKNAYRREVTDGRLVVRQRIEFGPRERVVGVAEQAIRTFHLRRLEVVRRHIAGLHGEVGAGRGHVLAGYGQRLIRTQQRRIRRRIQDMRLERTPLRIIRHYRCEYAFPLQSGLSVSRQTYSFSIRKD